MYGSTLQVGRLSRTGVDGNRIRLDKKNERNIRIKMEVKFEDDGKTYKGKQERGKEHYHYS